MMAVDAAESIIIKQGLDKVNARSIAKHMGYAPGTIYVVFKNLTDLKLHVNLRTLARLQEALEDSVKRCRTPESCIKKMAQAYCQFAFDNKSLWTLLYSIHLPGTDIPSWYREKIEQVFSLVEAQLPDVFKTNKDKFTTARTLWSGVHGICVLAITDKLAITNISSTNVLIDSLIDNYMFGLRHAQGKVA